MQKMKSLSPRQDKILLEKSSTVKHIRLNDLNRIPTLKSNSNNYLKLINGQETSNLLSERNRKLLSPLNTLGSPRHELLEEHSLSSLIKILNEEWETQNISLGLRNLYNTNIRLLDPIAAKNFVVNEIKLFRSNESLLQKTLVTVKVREENIEKIKEMIVYLSQKNHLKKMIDVQIEAAKPLYSHRIFTLNAIESITKWRDFMAESFNSKALNFPFLWNEENYLLKIRSDTEFLKTSVYSKIIYLGKKRDPLLIIPSTPKGKSQMAPQKGANYYLNDGQVVVPMPWMISNRVQEAKEIIRKEYEFDKFSNEKGPKRYANLFKYDFTKELIDYGIEKCITEILNEIQEEIQKEEQAIKENFKGLIAEKIYLNLLKNLDFDIENIANQERLSEMAIKKASEMKKLEEEKFGKEIIRKIYQEILDQLTPEIKEIIEDVYLFEKQLKENEVRKKELKEKNKTLMNLIYETLENELVELRIIETCKEELKCFLDEQIQEKNKEISITIYESLKNEFLSLEINEICNKEFKYLIRKQSKQNTKKISIFIYESIENELLQLEISKACNDEFKYSLEKQLQEKNVLISTFLYELLEDELLHTEINETCKEELDNIFGSQSKEKNEELLSSIYESLQSELILLEVTEIWEKLNVIEKLGLEFAKPDFFKKISELEWVPMNVSEDIVEQLLKDCYKVMPLSLLEVLPTISMLLAEISRSTDTRWYWAVRDQKVFGLLIFSQDCFSSTPKLVAHHISSFSSKEYPLIMESATQFMIKTQPCDETQIQFFTNTGSNLRPEVTYVMNAINYQFKQKFIIKNRKYDINVFARTNSTTEKISNVYPFRLKVICSLFSTTDQVNSNSETRKEMAFYGNRHILLKSLMGIITKPESVKMAQTSSNPLQNNVSELLSTIIQGRNSLYPNFKVAITDQKQNIDIFCNNNHMSLMQGNGPKLSLSILDLNFRWISCTNVLHSINGENYKFMRFKSPEIIYTKSENADVIKIPTELPNIFAFFIHKHSIKQEIKKSLDKGLDVFDTAQRLLKTGEKVPIYEVWVPCFKKEKRWNVSWIEGYEIAEESANSRPSYIKRCVEETFLSNDGSVLKEGLLVPGKKKGPIIKHPFIFGLFISIKSEFSDLPLFTCLVDAGDWIKLS